LNCDTHVDTSSEEEKTKTKRDEKRLSTGSATARKKDKTKR
jgi:hypothetical protein